MRTNAFLSLAVLLVSGGALAGCGEEPIPDVVSYARDIKPLMEARCIRCHGAGGTENKDPSLPAWFVAMYMTDMPKPSSDFTTFDKLKPFGGLMKAFLVPVKADATLTPPRPAVSALMPPPPSPTLTDRERDMLIKWGAAPNP